MSDFFSEGKFLCSALVWAAGPSALLKWCKVLVVDLSLISWAHFIFCPSREPTYCSCLERIYQGIFPDLSVWPYGYFVTLSYSAFFCSLWLSRAGGKCWKIPALLARLTMEFHLHEFCWSLSKINHVSCILLWSKWSKHTKWITGWFIYWKFWDGIFYLHKSHVRKIF